MEKNGLTQRLLGAALMVLVGLAAWLEGRSPVARALRERKPVLVWTLAGDPPREFLLILRPARRAVEVVAFSKPSAAQALRGLPEVSQAPALSLSLAAPQAPWTEPPADLRRALVSGYSGLGFLSRPVAGAAGLDGVFLAAELARVPPKDWRPAWLPDGAAGAEFVSALLAETPGPPHPARPITAEVLNATGQKGVASAATKILRSKGVDVVSVGNAEGRSRTVVYDRTGRFSAAAAVAAALGCPEAEPVTMIDQKRLVDVSVVFAADCAAARPRRPGRFSWQN